MNRIPVFLMLLQLSLVVSYKVFQNRIPNGDSVPHSCKPNYIWDGVGHWNDDGGGDLNNFGRDFSAAGHRWTIELCQKDSDFDGLSNGEELGDPKCIWSEGDVPERITGLSHPGVCDPYDSEECRNSTIRLDCDIRPFQCDALDADPDARNFTIRFPTTPVPPTETNYYCMTFDFDVDGDYHMVATEPIIDNAYVMHHIVLMGCLPGVTADYTPRPCGMAAQQCYQIIGLWTVGGHGTCLHNNTGFPIGNGGFKVMVMQFHWNNPELRSDYNDSSGMIIHYTPRKRMYDAGVINVGQMDIVIPPGREEVTVTAESPPDMLKDTIYITTASNHMHYLGQKMKMEHFRNGTKLQDLTNEDDYSYDNPTMNKFQDPIEFKPGDVIKTTCSFGSTRRTSTVFYGDGTSDEMCYGFIGFYPNENVYSSFFVSWKRLHMIRFYYMETINGCKHESFFNLSNPETASLHEQVNDNCRLLSNCLDECRATITAIQDHPCLVGDMNDWLRKKAVEENNQELLDFYWRIDSCNRERALESCQSEPCDRNCDTNLDPNHASYLKISPLLYILILFAISL